MITDFGSAGDDPAGDRMPDHLAVLPPSLDVFHQTVPPDRMHWFQGYVEERV